MRYTWALVSGKHSLPHQNLKYLLASLRLPLQIPLISPGAAPSSHWQAFLAELTSLYPYWAHLIPYQHFCHRFCHCPKSPDIIECKLHVQRAILSPAVSPSLEQSWEPARASPTPDEQYSASSLTHCLSSRVHLCADKVTQKGSALPQTGPSVSVLELQEAGLPDHRG